MSGVLEDLKSAFRQPRSRPGFAAAVLLSLVLGVGTNTAIFTLFDALFLRPLPVTGEDRLLLVHEKLKNEAGEFVGERLTSHPTYLAFKERRRVFTDLGLFHWWPVSLTGGSEPQRVDGMYVSANYFDLLGLEPALGRFYAAGEDQRGNEPAAVLSYSAWSRLFATDPGVLGREVEVNGHRLTVVGVAPRGFRGTEIEASVDVFMPLSTFERLSPFGEWFDVPSVGLFRLFGRLKDGATPDDADAEVMAIARQLDDESPEVHEGRLGAATKPLALGTMRDRDRYTGYARTLLLVVAILLIACLNVAGLLLVRGAERARELAVRQSAGGSRSRLTRQLLTENLVLFLLGGLLSLPAARLFLGLLWTLRPPQVPESALTLELDAVVWGFALALSLLVGVVFGLGPAWRAARTSVVENLKETAPMSAASRRLPFLLRPRSLLVALQVALAFVALVGAGLLRQSFVASLAIDVGFDVDRLAVLSVAPGEQGYDEPQAREYYRRLTELAESLPGVESAVVSENRLLRGAVVQHEVYLPGRDKPAEIASRAIQRVNTVAPGFFDTAGIKLLAGRDFTDGETADHLVAVVNETMAKTLWPDRNPLGQVFHFDYPTTPPIEVVGVAKDAKYRQIREAPQAFVYIPLAQNYVQAVTLHVRTAGDPEALVPTLRREVQALDANLALYDVATLRRFVDEGLWLERSAATLLGLFGLLAFALAVVGVYGLMAFAVSGRRRELGIRRALGARWGTLVGAVLGDALAVAAVGIIVGIAVSVFLLGPWIESLLYGVAAVDPATYAAWSAALLAAALLGALVPAWRAARLDPMVTLRAE